MCGNLNMSASLEAGIEVATQAIGQQRIERVSTRRINKEAGSSDAEEDSGGVAAVMDNLTIETAGTEEEAAENIQMELNMEIEEAGGDVVED